MKLTFFLISITIFISCNDKQHNKSKIISSASIQIINSDSVKNIIPKINTGTLNITSLPLGNSHITFNFPTLVPTIDENDNNITNATTIKIDSILKTAYHFAETKPTIKFNSDKEINETRYLLRAFPDRKSKTFENIYQLPNKYGFNIYIERITTINNKNNNTNILYTLAIYKGDTISNRYCIGYDYYGDLVESYKVWQIDKNFLLNTRIITNVAGNNETYISKLDKFTITNTGDFVKYFDDKNHNFKSPKESGKIENHLKEGIWFEVKDFDGYINQSSYLETQYKKGIPIGLWKYFTLETIEEANDEGYVINSYTKKGNKLLMTEEYDTNGNLLKREILKN